LGQRREGDYFSAAHQDVDADRQVVPQSTCLLESQGSTFEANQSESRAEGFDRIPRGGVYLFFTEECKGKSTAADVARLRRQALPEATQEAAPKG